MTEKEIELLVNEKYPRKPNMTGTELGEWSMLRFDYRHFLLDADRQATEYQRSTDEICRDSFEEVFSNWKAAWRVNELAAR